MENKRIVASITHDRAILAKAVRFSAKELREFAAAFKLPLFKILNFIIDGDWRGAQKEWGVLEFEATKAIDACCLANPDRFSTILHLLMDEIFSLRPNMNLAIMHCSELVFALNIGHGRTAKPLYQNLVVQQQGVAQLLDKDTQIINELNWMQRQPGEED